jgi:3-hydroxyisobutyrate dehydrogenase
MRVAFLGLGRMGVAMARHVAEAGHELHVWNRTPGKAGDLVEAGAVEEKTVGDAVQEADAVVLMLFGPDSVREVLPDVLAAAPKGVLVVDSTTIGPDAAREFAAQCDTAGARYVDAPVAGSVAPATAGTLGVLAGAREQDWAEVEPLLQLWGDPARVRRVGPVGAGSALKLVVNQGQAAYGWTLNQKRAMVDAGDFSGTQFSVDLLTKDLELAVEAARDARLGVTQAALEAARSTIGAGHAGEDYAAIIGHLADEGEADSH